MFFYYTHQEKASITDASFLSQKLIDYPYYGSKSCVFVKDDDSCVTEANTAYTYY
jgi:hypothetical protein